METELFYSISRDLDLGYKSFCLEINLFSKRNEECLKWSPEFWAIIQQGLIFHSIGTLARLTELSDSDEKPLTIFTVLESRLQKHKSTRKKIKGWRNNIGFHKNIKASLNLKKKYEQIDLNRKEVADLYKELFQIMDEYKNNFGLKNDFNDKREKIENSAKIMSDDIVNKIKNSIEHQKIKN